MMSLLWFHIFQYLSQDLNNGSSIAFGALIQNLIEKSTSSMLLLCIYVKFTLYTTYPYPNFEGKEKK